MILRYGFLRVVTFAAAGLCTAGALCQTTHHVAWSKIEAGPWRFNPIYTQEQGAAPAVVSFLALADSSALLGDNIVAVWYTRDGSTWSSKSWETSDPWEAIKSVKQYFEISDDEDERWGIPGSDSAIANPEAAQNYQGGLLASDPLAELVNSAPNRAELVAFLTAGGYASAALPVDADDVCTTDDKLDGMAEEVVGFLASGDNTVFTLSASVSICEALAGVYPEAPPWGPAPNVPKPPKPATAPGWTPAPVTPSTPGWTPNSWSPWVCTAMYSDSRNRWWNSLYMPSDASMGTLGIPHVSPLFHMYCVARVHRVRALR